MNSINSLFEKHRSTLDSALKALSNRTYYTAYPESPKSYQEDGDSKARAWFSSIMNQDFKSLHQTEESEWNGVEISPFLQIGIGVKYPVFTVDALINKAEQAQKIWSKTSVEVRAGILIEALEKISNRFFDIAHATMHTTGQGYMMAFQASGPHANDRALEAVAMGYQELTRFPQNVEWIKNLGKFDLKINKDWNIIPKGVGLVIGCSTFPTWNTVPGLFATLITGNACIVKPHSKVILPIAIVVEEIQNTLNENGFDTNTVQLAVGSEKIQITKQLCEHKSVKMIDYTGNSEFGNYIETLPKTTFTEKAGVNSIILDSVVDLKSVLGNIAFSASLYSGQMCTAPQNIFVSENGVNTNDGIVSFDEVSNGLADAITSLVDNPKAGAPTLGAIQAEATYKRVQEAKNLGGKLILDSKAIKNEEFEHARIATPVVIVLDKSQKEIYNNECFGPIVFVIKTEGIDDSIQQAKYLANEKGALTCGAYTTDENTKQKIKEEMNSVYVPVSFNFTGAGFINSHAAFSDFHLTGANPAGNASFTNSEFVAKRFVLVGNRYM